MSETHYRSANQPQLTMEEMKEGKMLLWCKKCDKVTKHQRIYHQSRRLSTMAVQRRRTMYVKCLECSFKSESHIGRVQP